MALKIWVSNNECLHATYEYNISFVLVANETNHE